MNTMYAVAATRPEDMAKSRAWTKQFFSTAADLPIAFVLDGTPIGGIPEEWHLVSTRRRIDANIAETVFEGNHPTRDNHHPSGGGPPRCNVRLREP